MTNVFRAVFERPYLELQELLERPILRLRSRSREGSLELDPAVFREFLAAPWDILPSFQGPVGRRLRLGRGMDHPRYGRFIYSFARAYKPDLVVEVGSYAGGTAIGWATALKENGGGRLICLDQDVYAKGTFPTITRTNLEKTGLPADRVELMSGDSRLVLPDLARRLARTVDAFLVDADHTYEGALADLENGLPMLRPGGMILVHDVDRHFGYLEATPRHPAPVYEAFMDFVRAHAFDWTILKYIRRHLGIVRAK